MLMYEFMISNISSIKSLNLLYEYYMQLKWETL
jgi:hypothetical protein